MKLRTFLDFVWDTQIFLMYVRVGLYSGACGLYYFLTRWFLGTL